MAKEVYAVMCIGRYYETLIGTYSNESEAIAKADELNAEVEGKKKRFMELSETCTYFGDWLFNNGDYDEKTLEYCELYEWDYYYDGADDQYVVKKTLYYD